MGAKTAAAWPFESLRESCRAEFQPLAIAEVLSRPFRMEAGFYASEGYRALQAMEHSGFEMRTIYDHAQVIWPGVFARRFVKDPGHGIPFLSTSGMMEARPRSTVFLSRKNTKNMDAYLVAENTVLVSRSGTVGSVALVTKDIEGWAVSDDAIRVIVRDQDDLGPVYCFLQSPPGQFLLKRSQSGSVVTHIYEQDVATLPIPGLPRRLRKELTRLIKKASAFRVEANRLLDDAEEWTTRQISSAVKEDSEIGPVLFGVDYRNMLLCQKEEGYQRIDVHYYLPKATRIRSLVKQSVRWGYLGDLVHSVVLIGKTFVPGVYKVESDHGIPFFTGKELFKTRVTPLTFITSRNKRDIHRLLVTRGATLVTCAGTVGKVTLVADQLKGSAVTHDAIRVVPNDRLASGYVYAFLSSPLGQEQLNRCRYGSVIPRLHRSQLERIVLPIPEDRGKRIGVIVDDGFKAFSLASESEDEAFELFKSAIIRGREATEMDWGKEY
jgi:type I restriction enzyme, S subunit